MTNRIKEAEVILRLRGIKHCVYFTQGKFTKEGLCNYYTFPSSMKREGGYCSKKGSVLLVEQYDSDSTAVCYVLACEEHAKKYLKIESWSLA